MIPGWVQKFEENLETDHPLRFIFYHPLGPISLSNALTPFAQLLDQTG
jgi:hypothetical protein